MGRANVLAFNCERQQQRGRMPPRQQARGSRRRSSLPTPGRGESEVAVVDCGATAASQSISSIANFNDLRLFLSAGPGSVSSPCRAHDGIVLVHASHNDGDESE